MESITQKYNYIYYLYMCTCMYMYMYMYIYVRHTSLHHSFSFVQCTCIPALSPPPPPQSCLVVFFPQEGSHDRAVEALSTLKAKVGGWPHGMGEGGEEMYCTSDPPVAYNIAYVICEGERYMYMCGGITVRSCNLKSSIHTGKCLKFQR